MGYLDNDKFIYNDGGRAEAGYKNPRGGGSNDCVVRSIAIATGRPYAQVFREMTQAIQDKAPMMSDRAHARKYPDTHILIRGVSRRVWEPYLLETVGGWEAMPGAGKRLRPQDLPARGPVIVNISRHLTAVIDGHLYDTWDCMKSGRRPIRTYYVQKEVKPMIEEPIAVVAAEAEPKRKGRRPIPAGVERRTNVNVSLPASEVERLRALGGGSASAGISRLLAMYASEKGREGSEGEE